MATLRYYTVDFDYDGPLLTRDAMQVWLDYWLHENGHYPERLSLEARDSAGTFRPQAIFSGEGEAHSPSRVKPRTDHRRMW